MHGNHGEYSTNVREYSGHTQHAGNSVAVFRDKFWLSLALTFPVVFWSDEVQRWLGYHAPLFRDRD
jgi:P-type Cu2+ transporter